jgi:uncharacterized protein YjbI with pentapeptide repeats
MKPRRPTPAFVVAVLALLLAVSGTSYAAGKITSAQIKNNTVSSADLKNNSAQGKDVKDGSLTGADIKDGSITSADLAASAHGCLPGTLRVGVGCLIKATRGPAPFNTANLDCASLGGRLASYDEVRLLPLVNALAQGVTWTMNMLNQYEYTSSFSSDGTTLLAITSDFSGNTIFEATLSNAHGYHCVVLPS